jgi:hypothetical protein
LYSELYEETPIWLTRLLRGVMNRRLQQLC